VRPKQDARIPPAIAVRKADGSEIGRRLQTARHLGASMPNRIVRFGRKLIGWEKMLVFRMPPGSPAVKPRYTVVDLGQQIQPGDPLPWGGEVLNERLRSGSRLFALQVEKEFVSFAWVSARPRFQADELSRDLISENPLVWIWDCVTPPEHRGQGYFPELICHLATVGGQANAIIFVRTENVASVRGIHKAGFQPWVEIAATRWTARIKELASFNGRLTLSSRRILPVRLGVPQRILAWLLDVFDWDIGPYSGT
jgi:hypothetical protein